MSEDCAFTPIKRNFSDIDPDSSPEISEPKRSMGDMEAIKVAIQAIQVQLQSVSDLKSLAHETKASVDSNTNTLAEINTGLQGLVNRVSVTEKRLDDLESRVLKENATLRNRVTQLEERAIKQEAYDRRDNLIIDGIPLEAKEDLETKVREIIRVKLQCPDVDMKFTRVHHLGSSRKTIVRFHFYKDRERVWGQRRLLKGTSLWLEEDFPAEWRNRRQVLYPILRAVHKAQTPGVKAFLTQDKLIINNQTFTINNLSCLPPAFSLKEVMVTNDENVFFGSKSSPLSNFFPATFVRNGVKYNCAEQMYTEAKALANGDHQAAEEILMMTDPVAMYKRGKLVKIDPFVWTDGKRVQVMEDILMLKFAQNRHLKDVLLSTGDKHIWEARANDNFFGAGMSLKDIKECDLDVVSGENHLGRILMKVREHLRRD